VETYRPLKALFERQGQSFLHFVGEQRSGVRVTAVETVELSVQKPAIEPVLRLEHDGLVWYRHLAEPRSPLKAVGKFDNMQVGRW
jgi:hypothetical protein